MAARCGPRTKTSPASALSISFACSRTTAPRKPAKQPLTDPAPAGRAGRPLCGREPDVEQVARARMRRRRPSDARHDQGRVHSRVLARGEVVGENHTVWRGRPAGTALVELLLVRPDDIPLNKERI